MITPRMKRRIKSELNAEKPTIWVGKEGKTQQIVNEISKQLEKKEILKVRILRSALKHEKAKSLASKIAEQTDSTLIDVRGHTILLYKRKEKR
jgi:RNA-binding protein